MRKPSQGLRRSQTSRIASVPSPVGGWNARDPIASMKSTDAVTLDNFFCTPYDVGVRKGYSIQTSGAPAVVNTLASYTPTNGTATLFSWSSDKIYNSTNAGAVGSPVITGNSTSTFQTVNYGTSGGNFLVATSGADLPLIYNGTVWGNIFGAAFTTTISTLTSVGTLATCTMTVAHNLKSGMSVVIAGCTPGGYNGTYVITVTSATAFTYVLSGALGAISVMGTASPSLNTVITGVDPTLFIQPILFKTRLWAVEKNSTRVWYMPALSLGGAANQIDFSSLLTQGGHLVAMADWSLDAGYGMDDYAVFVSSNGQVVVYKGTDPASPSTWALVGVYDLGSPVGQRCLMKYAGDLLLICQDGIASLSKALMSTRVNSKDTFTDKVQHIASTNVSNYGSLFGWQLALFPKENMLLMNVPTGASTSLQMVMNTISGAWSSFSGWNAYCFVLHNDFLYFGGSNYVAKAWDTYSDNLQNINFNAQQSFNYFGNSGQLKQVKMARPVISTDGSPSILFGVNVDFDTSLPVGIPTFSPPTQGTWDNGLWDQAIWGGDPIIKKDWQTAFGLGYCISGHIQGYVNGVQLRWSSTDFMLADGGMI